MSSNGSPSSVYDMPVSFVHEWALRRVGAPCLSVSSFCLRCRDIFCCGAQRSLDVCLVWLHVYNVVAGCCRMCAGMHVLGKISGERWAQDQKKAVCLSYSHIHTRAHNRTSGAEGPTIRFTIGVGNHHSDGASSLSHASFFCEGASATFDLYYVALDLVYIFDRCIRFGRLTPH
jgi:hypothetical protein